MRVSLTRSLAMVLAALAVACGGDGGGPESRQAAPTAAAPTASPSNVSLDKNSYPVFPDADKGADPGVPAEQGGRGFKGDGWETNTSFDLIGDPHAVKGGTLKMAMMTDFPSTLRYSGPNVSAWDAMLHGLVYETLLTMHPTTLQYIPALATHWQISTDKKTFKFRIDPNARWSDGPPVTADDVIASWKLLTDKTLQDPATTLIFSNFDAPVAESKYIVSVKAKTENWQNFLYFSTSLFVYPAHVLKGLNGDAYIKQYNYKMLPGTGAYGVAEQDVEKGKRIRIRRRKDYWGEHQRRNAGANNFDELLQLVVRDRNLEFEMFKKGDIDFYYVQRAQMWVEELNYPNVKRGLNQKRKIFNHNPRGVQGMAINTRREPYNDIRVRKALAHLFNRELMVQKMMNNEYLMMDSVYPGSVYENPANEKIRYDPQKALQLLAEAGWKDRDAAGRLVKNGQPLTVEIVYGDQLSERYFTIFQEDLRKVGITLNLRFVTFETMIKLTDERSFGMVSTAFTSSIFPNPEVNWLSQMADQKNTNNITGFKNKRADQIIEAYNKEFDFNKRVVLLKELDNIVIGEQHWILEWTAPYERVVYLNRFGQPKGFLTRIGDYRDIPSLWWLDSEKARKFDEALRNPSIQLGEGPSEDRYWLDFDRVQTEQTPSSK